MIDVLIDKLTNSIEEVATGLSFDTQITIAKSRDIRSLDQSWRFDWRVELKQREVFKLTIPDVGPAVQGLISLSREEGFIQVILIESHPENVGQTKKFAGVAGNLMAYAAKLSIEIGNEGYVAFDAKTELFAHYARTLGARRIGNSQRMVIHPATSAKLVERYFGEDHEPDA